jgi:methionyl-tRNA formyltransferase
VYSVDERIDTHGVDVKEPIDLDFFQSKLDQYAEYEYWAQDNFDITKKVNYDDLHNNVDQQMQMITGFTDTVKDRTGISLQDYSRYRYLLSMYKQTKDQEYFFNGIDILDEMCNLHGMIVSLNRTRRLPTPMPIKMNTMANKRSRTTNFDQAVERFNTWAVKGNRHAVVTEETISNKITTENQIYADK